MLALARAARRSDVALPLPRPVARGVCRRRGRAARRPLRRRGAARPARRRRGRRHLRVRERARRGGAACRRRSGRAARSSAGRTGSSRRSSSRASASRRRGSASLADTGLPALVKSRRLGYDGKGQRRGGVGASRSARTSWPRRSCRSTASCRSSRCAGATATRASTRSPRTSIAAGSSRSRARPPAMRRRPRPRRSPRELLDALEYVGVLAVELFEVDGRLLANEFAPRVHNTGHWTIDGAVTSQFENHVRAILGWPLGATDAVGESVMVESRRRACRRSTACSRSAVRTSTSTARRRARDGSSAT